MIREGDAKSACASVSRSFLLCATMVHSALYPAVCFLLEKSFGAVLCVARSHSCGPAHLVLMCSIVKARRMAQLAAMPIDELMKNEREAHELGDTTDFFKRCDVADDLVNGGLISWPGQPCHQCGGEALQGDQYHREKRLLCWAWLRAGGVFSSLPQDLVEGVAMWLKAPAVSEAAAHEMIAYPGSALTLRAADVFADGREPGDERSDYVRVYKAPGGASSFTVGALINALETHSWDTDSWFGVGEADVCFYFDGLTRVAPGIFKFECHWMK